MTIPAEGFSQMDISHRATSHLRELLDSHEVELGGETVEIAFERLSNHHDKRRSRADPPLRRVLSAGGPGAAGGAT